MKILPKVRFFSEQTQSYEKRTQHMSDEVKNMLMLLNHANVVKICTFMESPEYLLILMEYAEQGDLLSYISKFPGNFLPEAKAKLCLFQVSKGVAYIHSKEIAHRDLKLDNIFTKTVRFEGRTEQVFLIGDFGYSKEIEDHLVTQVGTLKYCPPEILNINGEYKLNADIWSLGCLFFAALSGGFPFHENYGRSLQSQITEGLLRFNRQPAWDRVS